jgi:hypothetical protein
LKILSILQTICGLLTIPPSLWLADVKAHILAPPASSALVTDFIPPSSIFEFVLVFLSLIILTCGFFQWKGSIKYWKLQIAFGGIMAVISIFLGIRAATLGHLEKSGLYYVVYVLVSLGLAVCVTGLLQYLKLIKGKKP